MLLLALVSFWGLDNLIGTVGLGVILPGCTAQSRLIYTTSRD